MDVPAAAEVAAAKAAHVAAAEAAAKVAAVEPAAEVTAAEPGDVAKIPAGEMSPAAVETAPIAAVEATAVAAIAITVIRVPRTVTVVVAGTIVQPVGIAAAVVGIARENVANYSSGDGCAGVIAVPVSVAMPIAPYVMTAASVRDAAICMRVRDAAICVRVRNADMDRMCGVMDD